ncbi:hypothetical protein MXD81_36235 [Microbacteriaceae bacterium K1510]|nr:hypothetical protein [Microbacteriaceae bacterium K1510]
MHQIVSIIAAGAGLVGKPALHLLAALFTIDRRPYRPERYYMRGPGPKWREKHAHMALIESQAARTSARW